MKTKTHTKTKTNGHKKNKCICGCGTPTNSKFAPGHDSKLHSLVDKIARREAKLSEVPKDAREYLARAPWMTKKMREAIGLKKAA